MSDATVSALAAQIRTVQEVPHAGTAFPFHVHGEWAAELPWLIHGTTGRSADFDLGLFGDVPVSGAMQRWRQLRDATGCRCVVHARQVHESGVIRHEALPAGLFVADAADGHITSEPGILLTVSVADCVPVSLVDVERRVIALLHAGWRGIAAGILEAGLRAVLALTDGETRALRLHLGPSICGECYEVGPEVHEALGLAVPPAPRPVDLRAILATRAVDAGILPEHITVSAHCTRCGPGDFFSYRRGDAGRQMAVLGIREPRGAT